MADGFEPGRVAAEIPMARLHGMRVELLRLKRSLVYGSVVAITWLVPLVAVALAISFS
jgi:hypothetical protein